MRNGTPKRTINIKKPGFWWGYATALAITGLSQDLMGKDAYLRSVRTHWISGYWTIPVELTVIGIALLKGIRALSVK